MHYSTRYVVSSYSKLTFEYFGIDTVSRIDTEYSIDQEACMRFFKSLRRKRRQPNPPFHLLELDLPFEDVMADLTYPSPKLV